MAGLAEPRRVAGLAGAQVGASYRAPATPQRMAAAVEGRARPRRLGGRG